MITEVTDKSTIFSEVLKEINRQVTETEYRTVATRMMSGALMAAAAKRRIELMHMPSRFHEADALAQTPGAIY